MEDQNNRKNTSKWTKKSKIVVGSLLGVLLIIILIISLGGSSTKAKYEVSDTQVTFVDDKTVSVSFKVTNTGNASGQPWCNVNAHDPRSDYYGGERFQLSDSIPPNDTKTSAGPVTITKNGAQYVTTADVTCD